MLPNITPFPVRVVVIVTVLLPVLMVPVVMFSVPTLTLLSKPSSRLEEDLFSVRLAKVVAPLIVVFNVPVNAMVPEEAVKVPLLVQLPSMVCVKVDALKVVEAAIVISPFTVTAPPAVFVLPLDSVRLP